MRQALADPMLLGRALEGESWRAWCILLIAALGETLTDDEREVFARLTGRPREALERIDEFWAVVGRRGGKSRAIAVLLVYLAALVDYSPVLSVGEKPVVLCMAPTRAGGTELRHDWRPASSRLRSSRPEPRLRGSRPVALRPSRICRSRRMPDVEYSEPTRNNLR
jgi:hypothetical protein